MYALFGSTWVPSIQVTHMRSFSFLFSRHPRTLLVSWGLVASLSGCDTGSGTSKPGWYLEKTGDAQVQLVSVSPSGQRQVWEGKLTDESPQSTPLNPLPRGQDNGLFRWSRTGCADLSFVLTREDLKCTTCMQPSAFVPYTASCPLDQQRLPVVGWTAVGLERAK